jgi:flavin reductase (DIM6/NTAB) family NADH-FMN oxidoreductase RutF
MRRPEVQHDLRHVMRNFVTGVCVVTTYRDGPDGRRHDAVTVNSFTSVSLRPPLVSVCLREDSRFLGDLLTSGVFAVSILDADGEQVARSFAVDRDARAAAVLALDAQPGAATGALVLPSSAWLECVQRDRLPVGDHVVVIGEVVALHAPDRHEPLIFLQGVFHTLKGAMSTR